MRRCPRLSLAVAASSLALWVTSGCVLQQPPLAAQLRPPPSAQPLAVRSAPGGEWISDRYTDLPIPRDYQYMPDESFVFAQEGYRSADLRYEGSLSVEDLIRFYQESMPTNGWKFLRLTGVRMKTLTFTNEGEVCEIIIMSVVPRRVEDAGRQNDSEWLRSRPASTHLHIKVNPS